MCNWVISKLILCDNIRHGWKSKKTTIKFQVNISFLEIPPRNHSYIGTNYSTDPIQKDKHFQSTCINSIFCFSNKHGHLSDLAH